MKLLQIILLSLVLCVPASAQDISGKQLFMRNWTSAETSTDGLGPLYNEASCHACHWFGRGARISVRKGGEVAAAGVLLRNTFVDGRPDPHYGYQLQNKAVAGLQPEGVADVVALPAPGGLTRFSASVRYASGPGRTPGSVLSLRAAPALDASGLVSQISPAAIAQNADPDDKDGDGVSGRMHVLKDGSTGRFNWKSTMARIDDQIATALWFDMGLTSSARPQPYGECTRRQADCLVRSGSQLASLPLDVDDDEVARMAAFVSTLGEAPDAARLPVAPESFAAAGCAVCHVPEMQSVDGRAVALFSDLLLHDMGEGLTSYGSEGDADPSEWRTTPLIGFRGHIGGHRYLHDGRAANIDEAIRWHGGEAQAAREAYIALPAIERLRLTIYVQLLLSAMALPEPGK